MVGSNIDDKEFPDFHGDLTRERLVGALKWDLLGPEDPNEQLSQSPSTRYLVGILSPGGTHIQSHEDESIANAADDDEGGTGGSGLQNGSLEPSSIGLSFLVDDAQGAVDVFVEWGEYHPDEIDVPATTAGESESLDVEDEPVRSDDKVQTRKVWSRSPESTSLMINTIGNGSQEVGADIFLDHYSRPYQGSRVISLFLRNGRPTASDGRSAVSDNLFQPKITVTASPLGFIARNLKRESPDSDPDLASADLIYRNRLEYAVGHGASAGWDKPDADSKTVGRVFTEIIPVTEVDQVKGPDGLDVEMDVLADLDSTEELEEALMPLIDAYASWIDKTKSTITGVAPPHDVVATEHMQQADLCLQRIRSGLDLLKSDPLAFEAFRFTNRAMAMQRRATVRSLSVRRGEPVPSDIPARWRPFQLAFILQSIQGIADPGHAERSTVDLLWYPTGGGKTEAYLGLTAFTIALRRLWGVRNGLDYRVGSAVLMRYTLRLLTIQQFQRAAALMCAAELIRSTDKARWGDEPITIGLWVGQSVTPNDYADSKKALETLKTGGQIYRSSPYQMSNCPWCGTEIPPSSYVTENELKRTLIKCRNLDCEFSGSKSRIGIPALVVDEEIYSNPPSLLLATVDKFARLPWRRETGWLFGGASHRCDRHGFVGDDHAKRHRETAGFRGSVTVPVVNPPASFDLVIQDELHLISGPMGSLVGAYEAVIDRLSEKTLGPGEDARIGPKIVASTATVRRARDQIRSLFARDSAVFPPPGIDADDSFFAEKDTEKPGRLYVGVFGPGRSIKTTLVRTYACLLTRAKYEFETEGDETNDSYMTLIGYFNSIRELGGAVRLIADDVPARIRVLRRRKFGPQRYLIDEELTSRRQSHQISRTLAGLERNFRESNPKRRPYDVLLASNMLSVGVDIDRLGLMVMSAQPKTTAEYIQASSRIGRQYPGLVVQVYNWIRPRDISHYERFRNYHETFYRHVEATSVTPFSERAQDRALPGVLSAIIRHSVSGMDQNRDAGRLDKSSTDISEIIQALATRSAKASGRGQPMEHATRERVRQLIDEWDRVAAGGTAAVAYSGWGASDHQILLSDMADDRKSGVWQVSNSLREVEAEVDVVLIDGQLDGDSNGD